METPKFHGVQVLYLGNKNAIVDKIEGSHIFIIEDGGTPHTLSYPSSFFKTESRKQFLETKSKKLRKQLRKETEGKICQRCGAYSISLQKVNDNLICKECIEKEKRDFALCSHCQKKTVRSDGGKDCLGRFICNKCDNKIKRINFIIPGIYPIITVINRIPTHCKNANHCIESVRAKVLFLNGTTGARVPHEIDLLFCNDCKAYMCFSRDFELYKKRFGKLLLEVRFKNEYSDYLMQYRHIDRHYAPDTILSRWGYIAQNGKQSSFERRAILSTIMDYDKYKKPEIISILNSFLDNRGYRCPHAAPLWREDLEFVHQYDVDEPFVDLTKYSMGE